MTPFRVVDTGLREGRAQIAFDQALIDLHKEGAVPDTIRFLQFPATVLVGRHQAISQELHLDACRAAGVGIGRRITGGGALYLDEGQFGWELVFHRASLGIASLADLTRLICEAAAHGLSQLGIAARYRPRNDIEVDGRKISGTGGFFDGDTLFFQGTVLCDMDVALMTRLLNIPDTKRARHASSGPRVITLSELFNGTPPPLAEVKDALLTGFGERLGITPVRGEITPVEEQRSSALYDTEIGTDEFVYEIDDPAAAAGVRVGRVQSPGGSIAAHVRLEGRGGARYREVVITGDFFVTPPRTIFDLEAALRGTSVADTEKTVSVFFASAGVGLLSASPSDFTAALLAAAENAP